MATPIRKFRVDDDIWNAAQAAGGNLSDVIREALERHANGIGAGQTPDNVCYIVRYEVRTARGARRPWAPTETLPMTEEYARKFLRDWKRKPNENMRNYELVRREDYVISS